jgi:putative acetyltransferase
MTVSEPALTIRRVSPRSPDATALLADLSREIAAMYADRGDDGGAGFRVEDVEGPRAAFLVAYADGVPVGCGALRPYDGEWGEVKRMYTVPGARGRGVAAAVLAALEDAARGAGFTRMLLETGDRQPEAVRVYERAGYERTAPYGVYVGWIGSLCYSKPL